LRRGVGGRFLTYTFLIYYMRGERKFKKDEDDSRDWKDTKRKKKKKKKPNFAKQALGPTDTGETEIKHALEEHNFRDGQDGQEGKEFQISNDKFQKNNKDQILNDKKENEETEGEEGKEEIEKSRNSGIEKSVDKGEMREVSPLDKGGSRGVFLEEGKEGKEQNINELKKEIDERVRKYLESNSYIEATSWLSQMRRKYEDDKELAGYIVQQREYFDREYEKNKAEDEKNKIIKEFYDELAEKRKSLSEGDYFKFLKDYDVSGIENTQARNVIKWTLGKEKESIEKKNKKDKKKIKGIEGKEGREGKEGFLNKTRKQENKKTKEAIDDSGQSYIEEFDDKAEEERIEDLSLEELYPKIIEVKDELEIVEFRKEISSIEDEDSDKWQRAKLKMVKLKEAFEDKLFSKMIVSRMYEEDIQEYIEELKKKYEHIPEILEIIEEFVELNKLGKSDKKVESEDKFDSKFESEEDQNKDKLKFMTPDQIKEKYGEEMEQLYQKFYYINIDEQDEYSKKIVKMSKELGYGDELDRQKNGLMNKFRKIFGKKEVKSEAEIIRDKFRQIWNEAEEWVKRDLYFKSKEEGIAERKQKHKNKTKVKNAFKLFGGFGKGVMEAQLAFQGSAAVIAGAGASAATGAVGSFALAGLLLYGGRKGIDVAKEQWRKYKYMDKRLDFSSENIKEMFQQRVADIISIESLDKANEDRQKEDLKYEKKREKYVTGKISEDKWNKFLLKRAGGKVGFWKGIFKKGGEEGIEGGEGNHNTPPSNTAGRPNSRLVKGGANVEEGNVEYTEREKNDIKSAMGALGKMEEKIDGQVERQLFDMAKSNPEIFKKIDKDGGLKKVGKEYINELKGLAMFQIPVIRIALTGAGGGDIGGKIADTAFEGNEWYEKNKYKLRTIIKTAAVIGGAAGLSMAFFGKAEAGESGQQKSEGGALDWITNKSKGVYENFESDFAKLWNGPGAGVNKVKEMFGDAPAKENINVYEKVEKVDKVERVEKIDKMKEIEKVEKVEKVDQPIETVKREEWGDTDNLEDPFKSQEGNLRDPFKPPEDSLVEKVEKVQRVETVENGKKAPQPAESAGTMEIAQDVAKIEIKGEVDSVWDVGKEVRKKHFGDIEVELENPDGLKGKELKDFKSARETYINDAIKDEIVSQMKAEGRDPGLVKDGQVIEVDIAKVRENLVEKNIIKQANELSPEKVENILENDAKIEKLVQDAKLKNKRVTSEMIEKELKGESPVAAEKTAVEKPKLAKRRTVVRDEFKKIIDQAKAKRKVLLQKFSEAELDAGAETVLDQKIANLDGNPDDTGLKDAKLFIKPEKDFVAEIKLELKPKLEAIKKTNNAFVETVETMNQDGEINARKVIELKQEIKNPKDQIRFMEEYIEGKRIDIAEKVGVDENSFEILDVPAHNGNKVIKPNGMKEVAVVGEEGIKRIGDYNVAPKDVAGYENSRFAEVKGMKDQQKEFTWKGFLDYVREENNYEKEIGKDSVKFITENGKLIQEQAEVVKNLVNNGYKVDRLHPHSDMNPKTIGNCLRILGEQKDMDSNLKTAWAKFMLKPNIQNVKNFFSRFDITTPSDMSSNDVVIRNDIISVDGLKYKNKDIGTVSFDVAEGKFFEKGGLFGRKIFDTLGEFGKSVKKKGK